MNKCYIFLDFDGVINTPIWKDGKCGYNFPSDGLVNNYQAICWLNELCRKTNAKIIVSSTWRFYNYEQILHDSGLDYSIEIVGCTDLVHDLYRTEEINNYLSTHPEIKNYVILDDEKVDNEQWVEVNGAYGMGMDIMYKCIEKLNMNNCIFK